MGLQGFHLSPLLSGTPVVYFSPLDFLASPLLWLRVLTDWSHHSDYSYVTTGGPPFALDLIVKKCPAEVLKQNSIDLSGVISIILGAEPIRASSLLAFAQALEPFGFSSNSYMPAYGLAENVLHVTGKRDNSYPPTLLQVESQALSEGRIVEFDSSSEFRLHGPGKWLVCCGEFHSKDPSWWPGMRPQSGAICVINPVDLNECQDGQVGELWITGKCVTGGYWNNAAATSAAYSARMNQPCSEIGIAHAKASWYRTGDLGVLYQGGLYITGRLKEMIIVNGTKHYPMDIEEAIKIATQAGIRMPSKTTVGPSGEQMTPPTKSIHLRPGGILATELENVATGKNELIVMVELIDSVQQTSSDSRSDPSISSESSKKSYVALANTVFKQCQRLPTFIRTPTIKFLARWGAKYAKRQREAKEQARVEQGGGATNSPYTIAELDAVEKQIRRTVIGRFGIPVAEVILLRPVRFQLQ